MDHPELFAGANWLDKAVRGAVYTIYRNRTTLSVFWGYTLFWRIYRWAVARHSKRPVALYAALFPRGLVAWCVQMARTSGLLGAYALTFWTLMAACAKARINTTGASKISTTNLVSTVNDVTPRGAVHECVDSLLTS